MKEIVLAHNKGISLIDDDDFEMINKYSWFCRKNATNCYAMTKSLFDGKVRWFYMHQLLLNTIGKKFEIDHKDRNGLNNQRCNISIVTHSDNIKNRSKHRGTSKYTGVSLHLYNKWLARININGKQKYLGSFITEIEAAKAYNKAAIATGNSFYSLNDV